MSQGGIKQEKHKCGLEGNRLQGTDYVMYNLGHSACSTVNTASGGVLYMGHRTVLHPTAVENMTVRLICFVVYF